MQPDTATGSDTGSTAAGGPEGQPGFQHLYAPSTDENQEQFNRRNGVFYPSGFALLALPDEGAVGKAVTALTQGGVAENEVTLLRPEQMRQLTDDSQHDAGLLSRIVSAELKQMTVLRQLSDAGNHFLLVRSSDETAKLLQTVGARSGMSKGLLFHTLAVEELPVDKETIPGTSPYGVNEVPRSQESDADMSGDHHTSRPTDR
jgi:hypothetical protein